MRVDQVAVPDEGDWIDLPVEHRLAVFGDALDGAIFADQTAMGIEQDALLLPSGGQAREVFADEGADFLGGVGEVAVLHRQAVVAEADDVRAEVGDAGGLPHLGGWEGAGGEGDGAIDGDRRAEAGDPDVGAVLQPIVVGDMAKAGFAPVRSP